MFIEKEKLLQNFVNYVMQSGLPRINCNIYVVSRVAFVSSIRGRSMSIARLIYDDKARILYSPAIIC